MKKLIKNILMSAILLTFSTPAFAGCVFMDKCAPKAYDLSSKTGQILSNVSGSTFFAQQIAQSIIKKELKKATKESFKVKLKTYSAQDLAAGRFKSLHFWGDNLDIEGVYLTSLDVKTLCDFNYVQIGKNDIKFKENMVLNFSTVISDLDLRKTMQSSGYLDMLNSVNLSAAGLTLFKMNGADIRIKNNKLFFTIKVTSPLLLSKKPTDVVLASDLKVEDGRIVLTKVDFVNLYTRVDLSKITYLLNIINPLTFSMDVLGNKNTQMSVQSVNIVGDKISVDGNIFIPKNFTNSKV